jgi:hypothetical protein
MSQKWENINQKFAWLKVASVNISYVMVDCDPLPIAVYNDLPGIQPALIIFVNEECILILILTIIFFK